METTFVRRGHILVIDDEELVTNALRRSLESSHDVVIESRAYDALERIRRGERFDAILCDLMMPEMSGMQLYETLRTEVPEQASAMIFCTAGASSPEARAFLERLAPTPRLEKPFELSELTSLIDRRLR